jgi:hypothetical protein
MEGGNVQRLRDAGLITAETLPGHYEAFIEDLSVEEVEILVVLKQRVDDAGIPHVALSDEPVGMPIL